MNPLRIIPTVSATIACFMILFLPRCIETSYANISICVITAGLYFASSHQLWGGEKGWKFDFGLGIVWLFQAMLLVFIAIAHILKPE